MEKGMVMYLLSLIIFLEMIIDRILVSQPPPQHHPKIFSPSQNVEINGKKFFGMLVVVPCCI